MQYTPKLTPQEIEQNHSRFCQRLSVYREQGLDFLKSREFILAKAGTLQGPILEVGAGTGYTTLSLAKAGHKFISVDKDEQSLKTTALNLARENLLSSVRLYIMDGKYLGFANNSFSNVIMVNLFHHIRGVDKLFCETDRVLRPNGKLILADFNKQGMAIVDAVHKGEGRSHIDCGVTREQVYSYFHGLGYAINAYADKHHWVLIAEKKIEP